MTNRPVIALAGNPNVGKTTLFNALTGARQTVGNWPGVTVEHKSGLCTYQNQSYEIIDLPGIYSLSGGSPDELVARNYILNHKPDLIINIVDASNLERNLYLTVQLMELGAPLLMCLSMLDIAETNGISIEMQHLSSHLGFEVVPLMQNKHVDTASLLARASANLAKPCTPACIHYDEIVETHLDAILRLTMESGLQPAASCDLKPGKLESTDQVYSSLMQRRWFAVKLIEGDATLSARLPVQIKPAIDKEIAAIVKHRGQQPAAVIADDRHGFVRGLVRDVVKRHRIGKQTFSDAVDKIILSKLIGLPIFFAVMYLVFLIAVKASEPLIMLISRGLNWVFIDTFGALLTAAHFPFWLKFLLSDALGGGIATIGSFIPPIFFIYVSLSILEDSGYMSRAAFIADKFMRKVGLPGKAFIPLLVGLGCTVPAIMATRTLESPRDRVFASILTPFMSCGGKLPVYTFLAILFFPGNADLVIFGLYLFGVIMAMLTGLMLKKTVFRSEPGNFVMELPPYHVPTFNGIMLHTWHRLKDFVLRAGKTILLVIIAINILQVVKLPLGENRNPTPILELAGRAITPVLSPMGIKHDNWQASVALISGLFAKEAIVGSMQSLYQNPITSDKGKASYAGSILNSFGSKASATAYLVFILLYSPCAAALTMLFKEHGAKWAIFAFGYLTALAWMIATLIYQSLNFGRGSGYWIALCMGFFALIYYNLQLIGRKHAIQP
ncbi:MAG: ferrous iron transport protein B [Candidatus Cloacimonas sp.]|jgi:ferrous iron transport protein B|nr:ferrous iron transport protein B [Candidatus Cloacimonas sp.]